MTFFIIGLVVCLFVGYVLVIKMQEGKKYLPINRETIADLHKQYSNHINVRTRTNKKGFSASIEDLDDNFRIIFVKEPQELYVMYKEEGKLKKDRVIANTTTELVYLDICNLIDEELAKLSK